MLKLTNADLLVSLALTVSAIFINTQSAFGETSSPYISMSFVRIPPTTLLTAQLGAEVETTEHVLSAGLHDFELADYSLNVGFDYQYTRYEYSEVQGRDRDLHRLQIPLGFGRQTGKWSLTGHVTPGVSTSSNVFKSLVSEVTSDDFSLSGRLEASYPGSGTIIWFGGMAYDRAFGHPKIYPVAGVELAQGDRLRLRIAFPNSSLAYVRGNQTVTARVYPAGHQWHVFSEELNDEFDYALKAVRLDLSWSYRFWRKLTVDLTSGYEFERQHQFIDDTGTMIRGDASDSGFFAIGLRIGDAPLSKTHGYHF